MSLLDTIAAKLGFSKNKPRRSTGYAAAEISRLTNSLRTDTEYINNTLRYQLRALRARSRAATQNNPFGRRFIQMCVDNIAGPVPFKLEACVKNRSKKPDKLANEQIETAYAIFCRAGNCDITGKWSMSAIIRLLVRIWATDGEVLVRFYKGPQWGKQGIKLQIIDVDRLWEQKNAALDNGGAIHMGVEVDALQKPVAYHIAKRKPSSWQSNPMGMDFERVPADEVLHLFIPEFAEQIRGVPWMYAALLNLVHMGAFEEAAVINARIGAAQMGFITTPDGEAPTGDGETAQGIAQFDAEPGTFRVLADGQTIEGWNPAFPQQAVEPFIKAMLRGVAAGLGVAYHNLANDLEGVNYSSARIGELDERDSWKVLQNFFVDHAMTPIVCGHWMPQAIISGALPFPLDQIDKYGDVYFQPRRWEWVDPYKEVQARVMAIDNKLTSRTRTIAEQGDDIEDVYEELAAEQELAKANKLTEPAEKQPKPAAAEAKPAADDTEED